MNVVKADLGKAVKRDLKAKNTKKVITFQAVTCIFLRILYGLWTERRYRLTTSNCEQLFAEVHVWVTLLVILRRRRAFVRN